MGCWVVRTNWFTALGELQAESRRRCVTVHIRTAVSKRRSRTAPQASEVRFDAEVEVTRAVLYTFGHISQRRDFPRVFVNTLPSARILICNWLR